MINPFDLLYEVKRKGDTLFGDNNKVKCYASVHMKLHEALLVFVEPSRWHSLFNKGLKRTELPFLEPFLNEERHLEG